MSFNKAKIRRFNENPGCAPGVGSYDPKLDPKVSAAVFEKTQRFKSISVSDSTSTVSHTISRRLNSVTSSTSLSKSARNSNKEQGPSEGKKTSPDRENVPVFEETPTLETTDNLKEISRLKECIKKLQKENIILKEKLHSQLSLYNMQKRQSISSPPTCCSSPLLRIVGLSPIPKRNPHTPVDDTASEISSAPVTKRNVSVEELQSALRKGKENEERLKDALYCMEEKCKDLASQLKQKPKKIFDESPTKNQLALPQLSPENREFIEAKHTALLRLSRADDEIYKLREDLLEYKLIKEKLDFVEKVNLEKDEQIEQLKTKIIKGNVELQENQAFFTTLKDTFEKQSNILEEKEIKLNNLVSDLNDEVHFLKKDLKIKDDRIELLKLQVLKAELALCENQSFSDGLRKSFDNLARTKEEEIGKLHKTLSDLNEEIQILKRDLKLKVENKDSLMKKFVTLKESVNTIKVEYEDINQKANDEIEQLTTEMENYRELVKEKIELEDDLKRQILHLKKEMEENLSELKLTENLTEEKICHLQKELKEALKERELTDEFYNRKIEDLNQKVTELERLNLDLKSSAEIARESEFQKQQLEQQLLNTNDAIKKLEGVIEKLSLENEILENQLKISESDKKTLKLDMDLNEEKFRKVNEELISLKLSLEDGSKEIEELNRHIQISSQKYEELSKEFQTVTTNFGDLKLEVECLKESELGFAVEINHLRTELQSASDEKGYLESKLQEIQEETNNDRERLLMENQVLKEQLDSQMEKASKQISDYEEREKDIWRRLIEKKNHVKAKSSEIEDLRKELLIAQKKPENEKWKILYEDLLEKVEPFKNQLDAYAHEKSFLSNETDQALKQLHDLQEKYAQSMGQANHKQKIQYLCKLQNELAKLRTENIKLKETNYKQNLIIQKYQPDPVTSAKTTSAKTKIPKKPSQPLKENTPSAFF